MGEEYQFLIGSDVLRGHVGIIDEVRVVAGSRIEWVRESAGMVCVSHAVNQVGPVGKDDLVAGTIATLPAPPTVLAPAAAVAAPPAAARRPAAVAAPPPAAAAPRPSGGARWDAPAPAAPDKWPWRPPGRTREEMEFARRPMPV